MTFEYLNELVGTEAFYDFIRVCEARQVKALSKIADTIASSPTRRLILLCGGSSAGKTTTAKRLVTQLAVNGIDSVSLSTDDYFVGDKLNPRDENGELDYEHVKCVDIPRLTADMEKLLDGGSIVPRRFDFSRHEGYDAEGRLELPKGGCIVLEGIHALNPLLVGGVDEARKFRIFIDPKPTIEVFGKTCLRSREARLIRRLVRDHQYRGLEPSVTLSMWPKVIAGEERWIKPFIDRADAVFNSYLEYELAVLKPFAEGLVMRVLAREHENGSAQALAAILSLVRSSDQTCVPGDSILRETIGGSQLSY